MPAVPRPLDAICRKAMALRPDDRYASALDLAADVERWLADEPVSAEREPLENGCGGGPGGTARSSPRPSPCW